MAILISFNSSLGIINNRKPRKNSKRTRFQFLIRYYKSDSNSLCLSSIFMFQFLIRYYKCRFGQKKTAIEPCFNSSLGIINYTSFILYLPFSLKFQFLIRYYKSDNAPRNFAQKDSFNSSLGIINC